MVQGRAPWRPHTRLDVLGCGQRARRGGGARARSRAGTAPRPLGLRALGGSRRRKLAVPRARRREASAGRRREPLHAHRLRPPSRVGAGDAPVPPLCRTQRRAAVRSCRGSRIASRRRTRDRGPLLAGTGRPRQRGDCPLRHRPGGGHEGGSDRSVVDRRRRHGGLPRRDRRRPRGQPRRDDSQIRRSTREARAVVRRAPRRWEDPRARVDVRPVRTATLKGV